MERERDIDAAERYIPLESNNGVRISSNNTSYEGASSAISVTRDTAARADVSEVTDHPSASASLTRASPSFDTIWSGENSE